MIDAFLSLLPYTKSVVRYTIYALYRQLPLAIIGNGKWVSLLAFILFISHSIGCFYPIMFFSPHVFQFYCPSYTFVKLIYQPHKVVNILLCPSRKYVLVSSSPSNKFHELYIFFNSNVCSYERANLSNYTSYRHKTWHLGSLILYANKVYFKI